MRKFLTKTYTVELYFGLGLLAGAFVLGAVIF